MKHKVESLYTILQNSVAATLQFSQKELKCLIVIQNIRTLSSLPCVTIMLTQYWVSIKAMCGGHEGGRGNFGSRFTRAHLSRPCSCVLRADAMRILRGVTPRDELDKHFYLNI